MLTSDFELAVRETIFRVNLTDRVSIHFVMDICKVILGGHGTKDESTSSSIASTESSICMSARLYRRSLLGGCDRRVRDSLASRSEDIASC